SCSCSNICYKAYEFKASEILRCAFEINKSKTFKIDKSDISKYDIRYFKYGKYKIHDDKFLYNDKFLYEFLSDKNYIYELIENNITTSFDELIKYDKTIINYIQNNGDKN